mmetsp:Transcript_13469/g.26858  ORF Transcript_13469/g.26858 Transcript_13469/m.26858 type:complete len:677 (-) Transcript_13469:126-2156(-)
MKTGEIHDTSLHKFKLQENVLSLKSEFGTGVRLRRTKAGPTAPFPIYVTISIETPEKYSQYDLDALTFQVEISEVEGASFAYDISVLNDHLPSILKQKISEYLFKYLETECGGSASPDIVQLCHHVRDSCFGTLINLVHEVLEPYESVNQDGSSVRRIAFVDKGIHAQVEQLPTVCRQSPREEGQGQDLLQRLEKDVAYLSKKAIKGSFVSSQEKDTYDSIHKREEEKRIAKFFSQHGIGRDVSSSSLQSIQKVSLAFCPTSKDWKDIIPCYVEETSLNLTFFIGKNYPSKSSILCRLRFADEAMMEPSYTDLLTIFEKVCVVQAYESVEGNNIRLKDIFQYCSNYADQSLEQALHLWRECKQQREEKETSTISHSAPKYMCTLENLQMDGIDAMSPNSMAIEVLCSRCQSRFIMELASFAAKWNDVDQECGHCHARISISAHARIIHESCNTIALFCCQGCTPLDILPTCALESQCQHCSRVGLVSSFYQGRWNDKTCRFCHTRNAFHFERISFQKVVPAPQKQQGGRMGKASHERGLCKPDAHLTHGQPLPDTGTCSHYRHSHRWLRFPCCGKRFPCDLCHEEATDGHEMKWATRMVCGFCSLEQSLGNRCISCQKRLTTSSSRPEGKNTRFWEGGTGQRNKRFLSVKDPHKYRNSKAKTVSKKAFASRKNVKT